VGLAKTCGPSGNEDCCESITIQVADSGVTYYRSFDGMNYMDMSNPATLAGPFALDKFEVTVERFESFIAAYQGAQPTTGSGGYPPMAGTGWQSTWPYPASQSALVSSVSSITTACGQPFAPASGTPTTPHLPMNCVDWYLAFQFCAWDGSRLPTEAEWNFVAAGGTLARIYPWLVGPPQIDSTFAWYNCTGMGTMEPDGGAGTCMPPSSPPAVGSFPKGDAVYGQADMAGSMLEPTMDFFGSYPNPCFNCVNTSSASGERVYRGGSWMDPPPNLDDGYRSGVTPTSGGSNTGIRCAR
jgi:formylglycine-generating enzyme required for sulfatase activity